MILPSKRTERNIITKYYEHSATKKEIGLLQISSNNRFIRVRSLFFPKKIATRRFQVSLTHPKRKCFADDII